MLDVPKGGSFADMAALQGHKEIGDKINKINKIITKLAEANNLKGIIDQTDFNDEDKLGKGEEMVDRLSNLVAIFNSPDLDFPGQSCRWGRSVGRRLRIPDAELRHRIGQEQGAVLYAGRGLPRDCQGNRCIRRRAEQPGDLRSLCVAKLASVPEIREFRVDAAVRHGDVTPGFRD
jgi:hypothetical protein